MRYILIITVLVLTSCFPNRKNENFMNDNDFAEFERQYSPDSSKILLNYGIDLGAFGYGKAGYAVLNLSDTTKNLRNFTLTGDLIKVKWLNNDCISAKIDIIPYLREGKKYEIINQTMNNVSIIITPYDYIEPDFERVIELRQESPNGQLELIAYRYTNDNSGLNFIHVSIIQKGQEIPKYGNFLIADMHSDYCFLHLKTIPLFHFKSIPLINARLMFFFHC